MVVRVSMSLQHQAGARPAALVTPGKNVPSFNGAIGFVK
jgi:hypothetical protein